MTEFIVLIVGLVLLGLGGAVAVAGALNHRKLKPHVRNAGLIDAGPAKTPPEGVRPAMIGALDDGVVNDSDLMASFVDLAARGYFQLVPITSDDDQIKDWRIRRTLKPAGDLDGFEAVLATKPFEDQDPEDGPASVTLTRLATHESQILAEAKRHLMRELKPFGWLAEHERGNTRWGLLGGIVTVVGLLVSAWMIISWLTHDDLRGIIGGVAIIGAGLLLASVGRAKPHSKDAAAIVDQLFSYRDYLSGDIAADLEPNRLTEQFNQHVAWAFQLGQLDALSKAVDAVAQRATGWGGQAAFSPALIKPEPMPATAADVTKALDKFASSYTAIVG